MYHTIFIFYLHNYGHKRYTYAIMSPVMKEMKKLFVLFILLCTLFGCTPKEPVYNKYPKVILGFDTMITMNAYATSDEEALTYSQILENAFNKYNQWFDKYNDYEGVNNIKTINDNAGKQKVTVEQPIIDLLLLAKEYTEITNGTFDITMGNTMVLWHNYRDQGEQINLSGSDDVPLPTTKELQESAKHAGWKYVEIDDENNTVYITNENVSLDVGAIAKGYTTEVVITGNDTDPTNNAPQVTDTTTGITEDTTLAYTNTKDGVIPTGIILSVAGLLVVGLIAVIGFVFFGIRSKRRYDED